MNPVILIHGIDDSSELFRHMTSRLRQSGKEVHTLDLIPNNGNAGIDELAVQLADFIDATVPLGQPLDLVGFSMGGVVCRYYLQRLGGLERVQRFISIASPHRGTWTAYGRWNKGARQMRPGSAFLADLNRDAQMLERIRITSIRTPFDLMIVPSTSCELGRCLRVNVAAHALMVHDRRVLDMVDRLLNEDVAQ